MKVKYFILLFLNIYLFSCTNYPNVKDELEMELKKIQAISTFDYIMIVPGLGCKGCIGNAEKYISENISRNDILFILTSLESYKVVQNRLGIDLKRCKNVFVDFDNRFLVRDEHSIYPILIVQKNASIRRLEFLSPNSNIVIDDVFK